MINPISKFSISFLGNKTYVVGHKRPDTDSICSSIAQANLEEQIKTDTKKEFQAIAPGDINTETEFALAYFNIKKPQVKDDLSLTVKEVMDTRAKEDVSIHKDAPVKEFGNLIVEKNLKTVPVLDDNGKVVGVASRKALAEFYLSSDDHLESLKTKNIPYERIAKLLEAKVLTGSLSLNETIKGTVRSGAYSLDTTDNFNLKDAIIVIGDRDDIQANAIRNGAKCIIVTKNKPVNPSILELAKENNVIIMSTKYGVSNSTRLLEQSMPISDIMNKDVVSFDSTKSIDELKNIVKNTEFRYFPVIEKGKFIGVVNRDDLLTPDDNDLILIDHNNPSQFIKGVKKENIVAILDHHRQEFLADLKRIPMTYAPVGASATLVAKNYKANGIEIPQDIAGILWCAIISDTDKFTSITTTAEDKKIAQELAQIAKIEEPEKLANKLLAQRDVNLEKLTPQELVNYDLKTYKTKNNSNYSVGQIVTFQSEKYLQYEDEIKKALNELDSKNNSLGSILIITDLSQSVSYLICSNNFIEKAKEVLEQNDEEFLDTCINQSETTQLEALVDITHESLIPKLINVQSRKEQVEPFVKKIIEITEQNK
ncbi:MAG: putative manganese-dependent inorganic diphosphatase [Candidatus Gastranaerophilales bacterium]|nr:putative manganese-dependent inorganic diphosphatase [Candidatus Gastranaerophilales bacterium]